MKRILLILTLASIALIGCGEDDDPNFTDDFNLTVRDLNGTWDAVEYYGYMWHNIKDSPDCRAFISFHTNGRCEGEGFQRGEGIYNGSGAYVLNGHTITIIPNDNTNCEVKAEFVAFDSENEIAKVYICISNEYPYGTLLKVKRR